MVGDSRAATRQSYVALTNACLAFVLVLRGLRGGHAQSIQDAARFIGEKSETMEVFSTTGVSGMTTYRLMLNMRPPMTNVYALVGTDTHPLSFPPAFQVAAPFGVNVGGVPPQFFAFNPQSEYDSWLTIGATDGSQQSAIASSPGFDFSGWSSTSALGPMSDAAIFCMNPDSGPTGPDPVCMGQVTVDTRSSPTATALLQGRSSEPVDWQAGIRWEATAAGEPSPAPPDETGGTTGGGEWQECDIPDINECISNPCANGATCLDSHNSTDIPHHAYRCACQAGFANGTCSVDWMERVALYVGLCDQPDGNCDLDIDECMSRPCDTGFTCLDLSEDPVDPIPNEYVCEPIQTDPCFSNPCMHGAMCAPAAQSGVGNRQWLLQCSEGVPTVAFSAPSEHNEISVYDGNSVESPRLLSCGGQCDNSERRGCLALCTTVQGTGAQMTLAYSRNADPALSGRLTANFTCEAPSGGTSGRRTQGITDDPIAPSVCGTSYVVASVQDANSPYAGMQTLQLSIELSRLQRDLYIIFGSDDSPMILPPAFQGQGAFGVDIGGIDPGYFSVSVEAEIDSWLTVGETDGSLGDQLTSVGIDFSGWTVDSGMRVLDGGVFLMDPTTAPSGSVVVAQITVPTGSNPAITFGAQGHQTDDPTQDWQCDGATWLFTDVVELTDGGIADLSTTNGTLPTDAYICTCTPGFADGVCEYEYIPQYEEQCTVPFGGNCEIDVDECISKPCAHGAACVESNADATVPPNMFHCGCPPGVAGGYCSPGYLPFYESQCSVAGGNCEIDMDECRSNPCLNGALCQDSTDSGSIPFDAYSCTCAAGYANGICAFEFTQWLSNYTNTTGLCSVVTGGNCDVDIDECVSNPCQHGGTCTDSTEDPSVPANQYHCECTDEWSTTANTDCADCHVGKYFSSHQVHLGGCRDCPPGTFSDHPGQVACTACAAGTYVDTSGADSSSDCHNCMAGQFSHEGAGICTRCPSGQYQGSQGQDSCIQCAPGSVTETLEGIGATTCTQCPAGQFSTSSTVACATCPPGSVTETLGGRGATTCTQCRAGKFSASSTVACAECTPGSITDTLANPGATTCTECRAGKFSELTVSPCQQCQAGSFSPPGSTDCEACGRNRCRFFPDDSDVAFACSDLQWVASPDQSTCVECPAGKQPSNDRSLCDPCQPGLASENGVRCLMCNDSAVNRNQSSISNDARTACIPCGPGEEANPYASECVDCAAGKFAPCTASGCGICADPLIVTPDRTGCVPAYRCPAAQSCVSPCLSMRDCHHCPTGSISAGGEECYFCSDSGPGWVANSQQTACKQCPPGTMPSEDRSECVACVGDYISMLGSECQRCSRTQVANLEHTKCLECGYGEVADNGVCRCGENYYNSSDAIIECSETCNEQSKSIDRSLKQIGHAACSRCPPCVRCPIGNGKSSTPLIIPGFGLPKAYKGMSIAQLLYTDELMISAGSVDERPIISVYDCIVPDFCSGDHFSVDRSLVTRANIGTVLPVVNDPEEEEAWRQQLVSLAAGARIRVESENDFSESTLGSSLKELQTDQLSVILYAYYVSITHSQQTLDSTDLEAVHMELAAVWGIKDPEPIFDALKATFTDIHDTVVVPDEAIAAVNGNSSRASPSTTFSCEVGHVSTSPLCALCEPEYAGGSTHTCKHCTSGTTSYRILGFLLLLALGWVAVTWFPAWVRSKARARMQTNLYQSYEEDSVEYRVVGASGPQGGSAFTYSKIIVSHFQVLLQFGIIMRVAFPPEFQKYLNYLSVFKGDLLNYLNLKCAVQLNLYSGFAVTMGFAPFACVVCLLWNAAHDAYQARQPKKGSEDVDFDTNPDPAGSGNQNVDAMKKAKLMNQMFTVLFCIYPFVGSKICRVFKCITLNPSGTAMGIEKWQQYNMEVDCSDPMYQSLQSLAVFMFFVYPIGVPAISVYVFWKNHGRLHGLQSAPVARDRGLLAWSLAETLPWWHGDRDTFYFMVRDYKARWYWWEIVEFIRKFTLTGLLIFAEQGSASQILFGITLAFGFGMLNALVRPYVDVRTNTFRILSDCSLFVTLLIILVLHFKDNLNIGCEWLTERILQWILIGLNFVFLFAAANQEMLRRLFMLYRQSQLVGILYNPDHKLQGSDGQCATLYRGQYRATLHSEEVPAAVKVRRFDPEIEAVETALMLQCDSHPNIVKLFKIQQDGPSSYVAMELGDCSIKAAVSKIAVGGEYDPTAVCKAIIVATKHLHQAGFVHGNITPANVVMFGKTPKLCGFSCARKVDPHVATEMNTMLGTQGYQPLEITQSRHVATTEVHNPEAVDTFGVGCTMFYILSGGTEAFRASVARAETSFGFTVGTPDVELNLLAGESGIELTSICAEGKHLLPSMLRSRPGDRASLEQVLEHPLFWTLDKKLEYLSDIGAKLPVRIHKSQNRFISEIEQLVDSHLGPYNEANPERGGSWSREFNDSYPSAGGWGTDQRSPESEESNYFVFGAPASKAHQTSSKGNFEARSVGLIKFIGSVYTRRAEHVEAFRFPSEQELCNWLLEPFPFLVMGVMIADQRSNMSVSAPAQQHHPQAPPPEQQSDLALNPLSADSPSVVSL